MTTYTEIESIPIVAKDWTVVKFGESKFGDNYIAMERHIANLGIQNKDLELFKTKVEYVILCHTRKMLYTAPMPKEEEKAAEEGLSSLFG